MAKKIKIENIELGDTGSLSREKINKNFNSLNLSIDNKADKSDVAIGMINKGSVPTIGNLPSIATKGDAYYVENEGHIYQYDGSGWNKTVFTAFLSDVAKDVDRINNVAPDKIINLEYKNTIGYKFQNIKYDFLQGEKYIFEVRGCNNNPPLTVRLMKDFTSNVSSIVQSLQTVTEDGMFEFVCNTNEAVNIQILTYTAESTTWNATFNFYNSELTINVLHNSKAIKDISYILDQSTPLLRYDNAAKDIVIDGFYNPNYTEIFNKSELKLIAYKTGTYQEAKLRFDNLIVGEKLSFTIKERSFFDPLDNRYGGIYFFDANDNTISSSRVSNEIVIPEHKYAIFVLFLNRRTSLDAKTVVTFKGISLKYVSQTKSFLPNYYDKYLDDKIKAINTVTRESMGTSDSFLYFTDIHAKSNAMLSPKLINEVLASTTCNKVVCGWDAIEAYGTKDDILSQYNSLNKLINTYISPYSDVLSSRGNHDFTIKTNSNDPSGYTFTQQNTRNMIFKKTENKFVFNEADQSGCYYYYDNKFQGIRYIVLDSCDTVNSGNVAFGVQYVVGKTQMDWIAGNAVMTTPAGYGIVFIMHIPITDTTGDSGGHQNFTNVLTLVESVQNKTSNVTINDSVYDFSRLNVNVLMTLSGHMHNDLQTYKNGVLHIVSASDAFYQDYKESPFFINPPTRGKGNTTEQLIDFINIDKSDNVIKAIRIGVGYDRTFNLQKHSLTIGNKVTLSSKLSGTLTWNSYNSVGNTKKNKVWNMVNDVVSVNNGTVTALKAGEAVVFAMDQNQNKEFFYIAVND